MITAGTSEAEVRVGLSADLCFTVTTDDTAVALGSGSLGLLGTPRVIAWLEAATCAAIDEHLPTTHTSVGTQLDIHHRAPAPIDAVLDVTATTIQVDGAVVRFHASATTDGVIIASGEITRVIVDKDSFMSRISAPIPPSPRRPLD